jgi:hypothetical protein
VARVVQRGRVTGLPLLPLLLRLPLHRRSRRVRALAVW